MSDSSSCPAEQVLLEYASQRLTDDDRRTFETHLDSCTRCQDSLDWVQARLLRPLDGDSSEPMAETGPLPSTKPAQADSVESRLFDDDQFDFDLLDATDNRSALGRMGKYEVLEVIGYGGMGVVFKAYDDTLRRTVAIKVMKRSLASGATSRRRFFREARAAAAINHNNVVTIHSVDVHRDMPYLVMEYVSGCSLRDRLRSEKHLEAVESLQIGAQIAAGLAAAHAQGVIHRDIKPGNIMLEDGVARVKITDFGLARAAAIDNVELTSRELAVGTPAYMAPEQVRGDSVDSRADLFALGCVLYAMLTGHSPFHGKTALDTARKVVEHDPPRLDKVHERTPSLYYECVARLLRKNPDQRYQSAAEVADQLGRYLAAVNQTPTDQLSTILYTRRRPRKRIRRAGVWIALTVCLLGLLASGLVYYWPHNGQARSGNGPITPAGGAKSVRRPTAAGVVTVAQSGSADYRTIDDALQAARPGTTIRVTDGETYRLSLRLREPERLTDLTIEAVGPSPATLAAVREDAPLIDITDMATVTLRGLRVDAPRREPAIRIAGTSRGITLDDLDCQQPRDAESLGIIEIRVDAVRPDDAPIRIQNSHFRCLGPGQGIWVISHEEPIWNLRIEGNRFECQLTHVGILRPVRQLVVANNIFVRGANGVNLQLPEPLGGPLPERSLRIVNNTFLETTYWLGFIDYLPSHVAFATICNNLVLGSERLQGPPEQLDEAADFWDFRCNWWEPGAATTSDATWGDRVAERKETIKLLSRDPNDAEFVLPPDDSPLLNSGCGGDLPTHIGARGPRDHSES